MSDVLTPHLHIARCLPPRQAVYVGPANKLPIAIQAIEDDIHGMDKFKLSCVSQIQACI